MSNFDNEIGQALGETKKKPGGYESDSMYEAIDSGLLDEDELIHWIDASLSMGFSRDEIQSLAEEYDWGDEAFDYMEGKKLPSKVLGDK